MPKNVWTTSEIDGSRLAVLEVPSANVELSELSPVEREVAALLINGSTYAEIAERRGRSQKTVANQARSIYAKLGVGSRAELARYAMNASQKQEPGQ